MDRENDSVHTLGNAFVKLDLNDAIASIMKAIDRMQPKLDTGPPDDIASAANTVVDDTIPGASDVTPPSSTALPHSIKWYAVTVGRKPGVFYSPNNVTTNIARIPGGNAIRCDTESQAKETFDTALDAGLVEMVDVVITREKMSRENFPVNTYSLSL